MDTRIEDSADDACGKEVLRNKIGKVGETHTA